MNDTTTPDPGARGPEQEGPEQDDTGHEDTVPERTRPQDPGLPEIDDDTIDRVERGVFDAIDAERGLDDTDGRGDAASPAPPRRRRRLVWGLGTAAAFVALAALVAPSIIGSLGTQTAADGWDVTGTADAPEAETGSSDFSAEELSRADGTVTSADADGSSDSSAPTVVDADREIITTGSTRLRVADVTAAADEISRLVGEHGGRVQELSLGGRAYYPMEGMYYPTDDMYYPMDDMHYPMENVQPMEEVPGTDTIRSGWVTVRVPAESFDALRTDLATVGTVISNEVTTTDVTEATVDLRARVDAAQTSVTRLTELMDEAGSVSDLLAAEQALSERQGELESLQAQLESLEGQVAMSTLSIDLTRETERVQPDPQGFGDGLATGWNSFVTTLNGIVIGLGFLIPWLGAIAVVLIGVWLVVRLRRRARRSPADAGASDSEED